MPCYSPLKAWYSKERGKTGKRGITFQRNAAFSPASLSLPCGQCIGCRLEKSRQWAVRCMHEKQLHDLNIFLTLTYDDEHLPPDGTLVKRHLQLFFKRLRKKYGKGIRFYACGEYGDVTRRPHYHAIVFNFDVADKKFYKMAKGGQRLYTSEAIRVLWPYGFNVIGDVDFDSCAYVARYIMKKVTGDNAKNFYSWVDDDGVCHEVLPEFTNMSRRPGIGRKWFEKYGTHAYQWDSVIMNAKEVRPPRYYDTLYEVVDSKRLAALKVTRRRNAMKHREDNQVDRRRVREAVATKTLELKGRVL